MSKYLVKTTEMYRADTESEAVELVDDAKADPRYEVTKSTIENRTSKLKGEVIDEWKRVTITKVFTIEKEPIGRLMPWYLYPKEAGEKVNED